MEEISEVEITENETNVWTQTVTYAPSKGHSEKTLKCEAHYDNNNVVQEPKKMAEISLGFTEKHFENRANNTENLGSNDDDENEEAELEFHHLIFTIVLVSFVVGFCLTIYGMWWFRLGCFKNWQPRPTEIHKYENNVDAENPKVKI